MLNSQTKLLPDLVYRCKPREDSRKEFQIRPQADEITAPDRLAPSFRFIEHQLHVGKDAVHLLFSGQRIGLCPERRGLHTQLGDEGVLLHVLGCEGLVKIIHDGDGRFLLHA